MGKVTAGEEKTGKVRDKSGEDSKNLVQKSADENSKNLAGDGGNSGGNREVSVKNGGAAEKKRGFGLTNRGFCIAITGLGCLCMVTVSIMVYLLFAGGWRAKGAVFGGPGWHNWRLVATPGVLDVKVNGVDFNMHQGSDTGPLEAPHYYYTPYMDPPDPAVLTIEFKIADGWALDSLDFGTEHYARVFDRDIVLYWLGVEDGWDMSDYTSTALPPWLEICSLSNDSSIYVTMQIDISPIIDWSDDNYYGQYYEYSTASDIGIVLVPGVTVSASISVDE